MEEVGKWELIKQKMEEDLSTYSASVESHMSELSVKQALTEEELRSQVLRDVARSHEEEIF